MKANIIFAVLLLTTLCAYGADVKEGIYEYDVTSPTTVTLSKVNMEWGKDTTMLEVPSTVMLQHHKLAVTGIGRAAFQYLSVERIILPASVTTIHEAAFQDCSKLTDINLPAMLQEIPMECFSGCVSLNKIVLPDSITRIRNEAFQRCNGLTELDLPETLREVGSGAFSGCQNLRSVVFNGPLDKVWYSAFAGCTRLKEVVFKGFDKIVLVCRSGSA